MASHFIRDASGIKEIMCNLISLFRLTNPNQSYCIDQMLNSNHQGLEGRDGSTLLHHSISTTLKLKPALKLAINTSH